MKKKGKKLVPNCVKRTKAAGGGLTKVSGYKPVLGNNKFGYPSGGITVKK